ncbi:MAG: glycosyltransferase family 39 protein [Bacteroidales bacterium]|nr:glycosyltransferase family 39 protein [Bacteroidales bacterium]
MTHLSNFFTSRAIVYYFLVLGVCMIMFSSNSLSFLWILTGSLTVVFFYFFVFRLSVVWSNFSVKDFIRNLFITGLMVRIVYVIISYILYNQITGKPFEFIARDSLFYHDFGYNISTIGIKKAFMMASEWNVNVSDMGYPTFISIIYSVFGKSVIAVRILQSVANAYTVVLIYKFTQRNFDETTARNAAIIAMLLPNFIYYCGVHLKEIFMVFLVMVFIERIDYILKSNKIKWSALILPAICGGTLFLFRTVLAACVWFSLFSALILAKQNTIKKERRWLIGIWFVVAALIILSDATEKELGTYWEKKNNNLENSLRYKAKRKGGNLLAERGSAAVFAPMILIAPFPTMVNIETQQNQMYLHGGYYVKNTLAFFVLIALLSIFFKQKNYRKHVLILVYLAGYLTIITFSSFALSERFHLPILPIFCILSGVGITQINQNNIRLFVPYLLIVSVMIIGWNWFKLAGRGLM